MNLGENNLNSIKNIILITIDCLRADHVSCYGYSRNTTPNIDKLAHEGILFKNAFSNSSYTTASVTSFLTSTYPLIPDIDYTEISKRTTLPEILLQNGFFTIGVHSNPNFLIYDYGRGFCKFIDPLRDENDQDRLLESYAYADELTEAVISSMENTGGRLFLWVHYMDVHEPYFSRIFTYGKSMDREEMHSLNHKAFYKPEEMNEEDHRTIIDLYDNNINYTDRYVGILLNKLKEKRDLNDTLIIITADHGQVMGERNYYGHGSRNTMTYLYDELIHVPLIFWSGSKEILEKISKHQMDNRIISLINLSPTILDLANISFPPGFLGESLANSTGRPIISQGIQNSSPNDATYYKNSVKLHSFRTEKFKLIIKENEFYRLFDLENDPKEEKDISENNKNLLEELKEQFYLELNSLKNRYKEVEKLKIKEKISRMKNQKDKQTNNLEKIISQREEYIHNLKNLINKKNEQILTMEDYLYKKDEYIISLEKTLKDKDIEYGKLYSYTQDIIRIKDEYITSLENALKKNN